MTNTFTKDVKATVKQILDLESRRYNKRDKKRDTYTNCCRYTL